MKQETENDDSPTECDERELVEAWFEECEFESWISSKERERGAKTNPLQGRIRSKKG